MEHVGQVRAATSPSGVPWGNRAWANNLHLESLYLATPFAISVDGPPAYGVSLVVSGWLGQEAVRGRLVIDPGAGALNDFGDRVDRSRAAARVHEIALTRLGASDPEVMGRRLFAITGAGMPEDLLLVMYPYGDRVYLKRGDALLPLYFNDGPAPSSSRG